MKRIAFAWVTKYIDFSTYEEALRFVNTYTKGRKVLPEENRNKYYSWELKPYHFIGETGHQEFPYTVEVEEPYRDYNMG